MKKKMIGLFISFIMVFATLTAVEMPLEKSVCAQTANDYEYEVQSDGTVQIIGYTGDDTKLVIPAVLDGKKVSSIGADAFEGCYSLEQVTISNGIEQIGADAFFSCSVEKASIPQSVKKIGKRAFSGCYLTVAEQNPSYSSEDGTLFNKDKTILIAYSGKSGVTNYKIPDSVKEIGESAFYSSGLTGVTIPSGVTKIGNDAFCFSSALKSVKLPKSVETLGREAFYACKKLGSITIDNKECKIYDSADTIEENAVIYGRLNSTAQSYAVKYNREFDTIGNVNCSHEYKTTTTKATLKKDGSIIKRCTKCGRVSSKKVIYYPKTIKLAKTSYVFNGKVKKPAVTVTGSNGKKISSSNYTVKYPNLKSTGRYTVRIIFKGNYTGTAKRTYTIRPKAVQVTSMTKKTKGFQLKWKKATGTMTGYQIQYATNSKFTNAKTVNVSGVNTVSKTVLKLEGQVKYYARVRAYKKVSGSNIYGVYSKTLSVETASGNRYTYKTGFYYDTISRAVEKRMTGKSYTENPNIKLSDLRYVKVKYYGFDNKVKNGELVVNKKIAEKTVKIFYELYQKKYQIQSLHLVDDYDADDIKSMSANNSSAFNYRVIEGSTKLSSHAYGLAIDINPMVNPCVKGESISPENGQPYAERDVTKCTGKYKKHMIHKNDTIYKIFTKYGFSWGGDWNNSKDYQHFEYNGK